MYIPPSATSGGATVADTKSTLMQYEEILSLIVTTVLLCILANLFCYEWFAVKHWRPLPWARWLILLVYLSAFFGVLGSWIVQIIFQSGLNMSPGGCSAVGTLCLCAYVVTKLVYLLTVEKAHVIRGSNKPRLKSKLYACNSVMMIGTYSGITIFNFHLRTYHFDADTSVCAVGRERPILIAIMIFDALVNIYLTSLFLVPLLKLQSIQAAMARDTGSTKRDQSVKARMVRIKSD
ncbi:hypothetical protein Cob_v004941 [Colletotrichum orbiculare MAFF 240422]|uniref:Integral membrane protein n=1 Tax=Colletotrichum orbiculare (strain 104-T / ATCC 96160 / CBS 514.97 / LARS 414 / MAFF 240422) TaxID=1213857 RepID=A0A484FW66_COLOR|nr:hypothetical protein Cob_v004941 [Colletotrichum orbiculare MAFF 240422]